MSTFSIELTEISPVEKDVKVTVPAEAVAIKHAELVNELSRTATIKGFRKGKVPRAMLLKRYSKELTNDLLNDLVREAYEQAVAEHKLEPVAMPSFKRPDEFTGEGPLSFSFTVEVEPPVTDVQIEGLRVERERVVVSEEAIEHEIGHLRERHAAMRKVEGRELIEAIDWVLLDFEGFVDGKPLEGGKQQGHQMDLSNPNLIDGFAQAIVGKKVGESFTIEVTFPADYHAEFLRSKPAEFKCLVTEISMRVMPEVTDDWAKDLGHESLEALRQSVRADLEKAQRERGQRRFKDDLWKAVVKANPLTLPPTLLDRQTRSILEDQVQRFRMYGIDPAAAGMKPEDMFAQARREAEISLNALYLQEFLSKKHDIEATPEEVEAKYESLSAELNMPVEKFRAYYEEKHGDGLRYSIRLDKLSALIAERITIEEVDPKPLAHDHDHDAE